MIGMMLQQLHEKQRALCQVLKSGTLGGSMPRVFHTCCRPVSTRAVPPFEASSTGCLSRADAALIDPCFPGEGTRVCWQAAWLLYMPCGHSVKWSHTAGACQGCWVCGTMLYTLHGKHAPQQVPSGCCPLMW